MRFKLPNPGEWTASQVKMLIDMYHNHTIKEISKATQKSERSVRNKALSIGMSRSSHDIKRKRDSLSCIHDDVFVDIRKRGLSYGVISEMLGISARQAGKRMRKLGLGAPTNKEACELFAVKMGWPKGTSPTQCMVLNVMAAVGVPIYVKDIAELLPSLTAQAISEAARSLKKNGMAMSITGTEKHKMWFLGITALIWLEQLSGVENGKQERQGSNGSG